MTGMIIAVMRQLKQYCNVNMKKNQASTGTGPVTFALPVRCSTNGATKPSTLGAG